MKNHRSIEAVHLYAQACVDDEGDVDDVDDGGAVASAQDIGDDVGDVDGNMGEP